MTRARWQRVCAPPTATLREIAHLIADTGERVALVIDARGSLLGIATDGDLRKALLTDLPMDTPVTEFMNPHPRSAPINTAAAQRRRLLLTESLICLPLITADGVLAGVEFAFHGDRTAHFDDVHAVIMAGGRGSRLRPLTDDTPKPLLPVGGQPILDHILTRIRDSGIGTVHLAVNYLADQIRDHFGDGSTMGLTVNYLTEDRPLGTAGALSLLVDPPPLLLVSNADILTDCDYNDLITAHRATGAAATACLRDYTTQIPYGVATTHNGKLARLTEKPQLTHSILAGIYILDRSTLAYLPRHEYTDMPDHLRTLISAGHHINAHPLTGLWIDIGDHDSYARAGLYAVTREKPAGGHPLR